MPEPKQDHQVPVSTPANPTTETTVVIREDGMGKVEAVFSSKMVETGQPVSLRYSHMAGLLHTAAFLFLHRNVK